MGAAAGTLRRGGRGCSPQGTHATKPLLTFGNSHENAAKHPKAELRLPHPRRSTAQRQGLQVAGAHRAPRAGGTGRGLGAAPQKTHCHRHRQLRGERWAPWQLPGSSPAGSAPFLLHGHSPGPAAPSPALLHPVRPQKRLHQPERPNTSTRAALLPSHSSTEVPHPLSACAWMAPTAPRAHTAQGDPGTAPLSRGPPGERSPSLAGAARGAPRCTAVPRQVPARCC